MAIGSFADKATELLWHEEKIGKGVAWAGCSRPALRKLTMLDAAEKLVDLRSPPGNSLEALRGDLSGLYSTRINGRSGALYSLGPIKAQLRSALPIIIERPECQSQRR